MVHLVLLEKDALHVPDAAGRRERDVRARRREAVFLHEGCLRTARHEKAGTAAVPVPALASAPHLNRDPSHVISVAITEAAGLPRNGRCSAVDLLYFPLIQAALLLPFLWLSRRRDLLEALALGAALAIVAAGAIAFGRFLALLPPSAARDSGAVALTMAVAGAALLMVASRPKSRMPTRSSPLTPALALAIAAAALTTVGFQAAVPHFGAANFYFDWWEHFDLARFYRAPANFGRIYPDGSMITSRTPLLSLLGSLALTVFGPRFTVFQLVTAGVGWLWVLPFAMVARRVVGQQTPRMIAILAASPLVLFSNAYTWPKGLVCFFVLLGLDRFLALRAASSGNRARVAVEFGLVSGAALMAHLGFIGYLLPLYGILAWQAVRTPTMRRPLLAATAMAFLVALPWYAWTTQEYGWRLAFFGYPGLHKGNPLTWAAAANHAMTLMTSFLPLPLAFGQNTIEQALTPYVRTAVGLLGTLFFVRFAAATLIRSAWTQRAAGRYLLALGAGGILFATLLISRWGAAWGWASAAFVPALLVLAIIGWARLGVGSRTAALMLVECALATALMLVLLWSPISADQPNARLATALHLTFLGQQDWPIGLGLLLGGLGLSMLSLYQGLRRAAHQPIDGEASAAANLAVHETDRPTLKLGHS
jgi:hypothetical protein